MNAKCTLFGRLASVPVWHTMKYGTDCASAMMTVVATADADGRIVPRNPARLVAFGTDAGTLFNCQPGVFVLARGRFNKSESGPHYLITDAIIRLSVADEPVSDDDEPPI